MNATSSGVREHATFYASGHYHDEIALASIMLYWASVQDKYLTLALDWYQKHSMTKAG